MQSFAWYSVEVATDLPDYSTAIPGMEAYEWTPREDMEPRWVNGWPVWPDPWGDYDQKYEDKYGLD